MKNCAKIRMVNALLSGNFIAIDAKMDGQNVLQMVGIVIVDMDGVDGIVVNVKTLGHVFHP